MGNVIRGVIKDLKNCDSKELLGKYSSYNLIQAELTDVKKVNSIE